MSAAAADNVQNRRAIAYGGRVILWIFRKNASFKSSEGERIYYMYDVFIERALSAANTQDFIQLARATSELKGSLLQLGVEQRS